MVVALKAAKINFSLGLTATNPGLIKRGGALPSSLTTPIATELSIKAKPRSVPSKPTSMQSIVFSNLMLLLATTQPMDTSN